MNGFIKLHRKMLEWEWYNEPNTFRLFIHLLLKANHKDNRYRGKILKRGSLLTGQELLALELGLTRQNIRTSITRLKSTNEITIKATRQGTEIQIVNYDLYQQVTNKLTNSQPTANQRLTSIKNDKKEKKDIKERKAEFKNSLFDGYSNDYDSRLLEDFFDFWTEHGAKDKKMRFEKEKSFSILHRLKRWKRNQDTDFGRKAPSTNTSVLQDTSDLPESITVTVQEVERTVPLHPDPVEMSVMLNWLMAGLDDEIKGLFITKRTKGITKQLYQEVFKAAHELQLTENKKIA